ncbi:MAG: trehalase family glycosidase [Bacteroidetes bacterium]|nr:trehalase family glycosidase [Bacteroidota bacterium]
MPKSGSKRLEALRRTDKCVISNAQRLIYAPTHPKYSHVLGLWDEAHFYNHPIGPLGTLSLLAPNAVAFEMEMTDRNWQPDRLQRDFESRDKTCFVRETISMSTEDTIRIRWIVKPGLGCTDAVIWIAKERPQGPEASVLYPSTASVHERGFQLQGNSAFHLLNQPSLPLSISWNLTSHIPDSISIRTSQGRPPEPRFDSTPFYDSFNGGLNLAGDHQTIDPGNVVYAGMHIGLKGAEIDITCEIKVECPEFGEQVTCQVMSDWASFFETCPSFTSSDPWFNAYFDYRLFGLRMNAIPGGTACIPYPAVCEGPGYFRAPITYSAQCHILETRWLLDPALAQGSLLNFIANQQPDGRFIGYLGPLSLPGEFFYHANWGRILELDAVHPDPEFLTGAYHALQDYVAFFDSERDPEGSGLYDILNHYETGQEYMHRYVAVESTADQKHWGSVFRLKGVDVSVYLYQIKQALSEIARRNSWKEAETKWTQSAQKTGTAILGKMWDVKSEMFFDIDPSSMTRTNVKAAVCFYPYLTDLVDESHLPGLKRHLNDPREFNTPFPIPSSSVDDPFFDADGLWKGERKNCPWNGRVWPMTNSHIAEVLASCASRFKDDELSKMTAGFISQYVRMMFFEGDPSRPNSFEHYHPLNGRPSIFRGVDDYQHSWILDLIIQYVCGVRPSQEGVVFDPFLFGLSSFTLENVTIRGKAFTITASGLDFSVESEVLPKMSSTIGNPLFIPFI